MADSVKVKIISGFDATGVRQFQAGMKDVQSSARNADAALAGTGNAMTGLTSKAKQGAGAVTAIAGALGQGTGGIATGAKLASGAMTGFATGGWVGLLTAGAVAVAMHFINIREAAKKAAAEMKAAFQSGLEDAKIKQVERLSREYQDLTRSIDAAGSALARTGSANDRLNRAGGSLDAARATDTQRNIEAGYSTRLSTAATPEARAAIEAEKNLELTKARNAENIRAAQTEANNAAASASRERQAAALAKERLEAAKEQLNLTTIEGAGIPSGGKWDKAREKNDAEIRKAEEDVAKYETEVAASAATVTAAQFDLEAATVRLSTVRTEAALAENEAVDKQKAVSDAMDKREAALLEAAANDSTAASLQADLNAAIKEESAARSAAARALGRSEAAGTGTLKDYVSRRKAESRDQIDGQKEEGKFKREIADLKERRATGRKLSREDQLTLDFAEQRGRAVEANGARAEREGGKADAASGSQKVLSEQLAELKKLNANLEKNVTVK